MVLVYCPLKQLDIIREIENYKEAGEKVFYFKRKDKIKLYFETTIPDKWQACNVVNRIIKGTSFSSAIMYNVVPTDGEKVDWFKLD